MLFKIKLRNLGFTLQVFSEANKYGGRVYVDNLLNYNVMALYFEKKKEDVLKRPIPGFQGNALLRVSSEIAMAMLYSKTSSISYADACDIIRGCEPIFNNVAGEIVNALVSEQVYVRDGSNVVQLRFRHVRFLEYLVSWYTASGTTQS